MARTTYVLLAVIFVLHIAGTITLSGAINPQADAAGKKYCVVKPDADEKTLQANIDFACSKGVDCKPIQPGGACYQQNNVRAHAQYAMNAYFSANGRNEASCDFGKTGVISTQNPSHGNCNYV